MKKIIAILSVITMLFAFVACSGNGNGGDSTQDLKPITVCLDWTPNTNHTGLYVALEKGYYKDAGFDVSIVQPPEDGAVLMCASNEAQFAVAYQDTIAPSFATEKPLEVTAVAALLQHNTSGIISRKGEGMDTPKGMTGKTYSTWESPVEIATLKQIVEADGGNWDKVKLIPNTITDEAGALKHKDTDAIWVYYGWGVINASLNGFEYDYFNIADVDSVFDYYSPMLIANNEFLKTNLDDAKAFLEATKKGYKYSIENPEDAAQILVNGDTTGSLKDSLELVTESQKWMADQYIADAKSWGIFDAKRWDGFYGWLWDNKLIDVEIPAGFGFTNDYLS